MAVFLILCWVVLLNACDGVIWTPELSNGSTVYACTGDDVDLPWGFTLEPMEESVVDVEWYFTPYYSHSPDCTSGWLTWLNGDNPYSEDRDVERMTSREMMRGCPGGHMTHVQCASRQGFPVMNGDEELVCNLRDGFECRNDVIAPASCNDYKIRYLCQCEATENDQVLLATLQSHKFTQTSSTLQNLTLFNRTDAGLTLHDVSSMDNGLYAVAVNVMEHQYVRTHTHYTLLRVADSEQPSPSHPCSTKSSSHPPSPSPSSVKVPDVTLHVITQDFPIG